MSAPNGLKIFSACRSGVRRKNVVGKVLKMRAVNAKKSG